MAPSLNDLPTVIWHVPLHSYLNKSVSEIRSLKTHGEKRVRAVLEVFHRIHELLKSAEEDECISVRLMPKFVSPLEQWMRDLRRGSDIPARDQVDDQLTGPLLDQLRTDAGETVFQLASGRLGFGVTRTSVREQSTAMQVTRARIYQLLDECGRVMEVRWPNGRCEFNQFVEHCEQNGADATVLSTIVALRDLFFPNKFDRLDAED